MFIYHLSVVLTIILGKFVLSCLNDFQNDEYGLISFDDYYDNVENKWIAGGGDLFGRYGYGSCKGKENQTVPMTIIKIRMYKGNTYILYDSEPDWLIKED